MNMNRLEIITLIKSQLSQMLTGENINKKLKGIEYQLILYPNLKNYNNLLDILDNEISFAIILIETKDLTGHYVSLSRIHDNIYYFDSYGIFPGKELPLIPMNERLKLHEIKNYFVPLIDKLPKQYIFQYNKIQFQNFGKMFGYNIDTCGKWNVVFIISLITGLNLLQFQKRLIQLKQLTNLPFDIIICLIYNSI